MRAVVMRGFGDEDVLDVEDVPDPVPGAGEVLLRVAAVEVSSTRDIATRTGKHPFSKEVALPHVLGGDFAGVVVSTGDGADPSLVGRRVAVSNTQSCGRCEACRAGRRALCLELTLLGIHRWGSYAELVSVPVQNVRQVPAGLPMTEAAALAATGPIAYSQLLAGQVTEGSWLVVTGATGSLGTTLCALGAWLGARVVGLSRRPDAIPAGLDLEARLDSGDPELSDKLQSMTGGSGTPAVIDNVASGEVFARYLPALAVGGRVVISGAIGGPAATVLPVPAGPFYVRSQSLLGVRTTNPRDIGLFWNLVDDGFRLPRGLLHEMPLAQAASAHALISGGSSVGHVLLGA